MDYRPALHSSVVIPQDTATYCRKCSVKRLIRWGILGSDVISGSMVYHNTLLLAADL